MEENKLNYKEELERVIIEELLRKNGEITSYDKQVIKYLMDGTFFDEDETLLDDAMEDLKRTILDLKVIKNMNCPATIEETAWKEIIARILFIKERIKIREMLVKAGIHPYFGLINKMQKLNHIKGRFLKLKEIKELFQSQGDKLAEEIVKGLVKAKEPTLER